MIGLLKKIFRKINNKSKIKCYDNQLNLKLLVRLFIIQLIFVFKNFKFSLLLKNFTDIFEYFLLKKKLNLIKKL